MVEFNSKNAFATPNIGEEVTDRYDVLRHAIERIFYGKIITKVLFVTPPDVDAEVFNFGAARRKRYTSYPPYGLGILANQVEMVGVSAEILDLNLEILRGACNAKSEDDFSYDEFWSNLLKEKVGSFRPDLIAVTCMFTLTHNSFRNVCSQLAVFHIPIAIGGVHVSNNIDNIFDNIPFAQFAFIGESDVVFRDFIEIVNGEKDSEALRQCTLNYGGRRTRFLERNPPSETEISLSPTYLKISIEEYSKYGTIGSFYWLKPKNSIFATTLSTRGCRAQCSFCSVRSFNGKGVRLRNVMAVVDEIQMLRENHNVAHIMWLDDDLLKDHRRALNLFEEIARRDLDLTWDASNGVIAAACSEELVSAMAESGCIGLNIGMESGNDEILKRVKKPGTVKGFLRAAEILRKYPQIYTSVFIIIGFPHETTSMIKDTIDVSLAMDCDWYRISTLMPLPNTPIFYEMDAEGLIGDFDESVKPQLGSYGTQFEMEQGLRTVDLGFGETLNNIPIDSIPSKKQLSDIWFYANYRLNFHRLFSESRPEKIAQHLIFLRNLSNVISPDNGLSLYFRAYLEHKRYGVIPQYILDRLRTQLNLSEFWKDRFNAFGLNITDFENLSFPDTVTPSVFS